MHLFLCCFFFTALVVCHFRSWNKSTRFLDGEKNHIKQFILLVCRIDGNMMFVCKIRQLLYIHSLGNQHLFMYRQALSLQRIYKDIWLKKGFVSIVSRAHSVIYCFVETLFFETKQRRGPVFFSHRLLTRPCVLKSHVNY